MKPGIIISWGFILFAAFSCTGGKHLEQTTSSKNSFNEGEYGQSLQLSEQVISQIESKGKKASGEIYTLAGASAFELEEYEKSLEYLTSALMLDYSAEILYRYLARNYRHIDNLSKEITALEDYTTKYPSGEYILEFRERLFQTCSESENFELADELWTLLDSASREDVFNLEVYMSLNSMQEKEGICDSLGKKIIEKDPENELALNWFGESYFWRAENTYVSQMKAYKEKRTHKQYAILLEAFKQVNADYKKSLYYFTKLWEVNPKPEYASYLANIYTRLEDEDKASYYKKRSN